MLNKPEILKGDVKEFVELVKSGLSIADKRNELYDSKHFYSQPFKPEMITEYFEGWGKDKQYPMTNPRFKNINGDWLAMDSDSIRMNTIQFLIFPSTLSQFITNCIQAGIKLTWKEK